MMRRIHNATNDLRLRHAWPHRRAVLWLVLVACLAPLTLRAQGPEGDVRAELSMDPERIYQGQTFALTLTIRAQGISLGRQFNLDGLPDSGLIELEAFQELPSRREQVGAASVEARQFRCRAYARLPGQVDLAPTLQYERLTQERTWFGTTTFQSTRRLALLPLELKVLPLPADGRPAAFSGAVGRFTFKMEASPRDAAPGDLVTLLLALRGDGRLDAISCPPLASNALFRVYPPRALSDGKAGEKRFEQIVIPESTNAVITPAATFSFFDPVAGAYRTVTAAGIPLTLHVRSAAPLFTPYHPDASTPPSASPHIPEAGSQPPLPRSGDALSATWWRATGSGVPPLLLQALALLAILMGLIFALAAGLRHRRRLPAAGAWTWAATLMLVAIVLVVTARRLDQQRQAGRPDHATNQAVTARLAPSSAALPLFELPPGAGVRVMETWDQWRRIAQDGQRGWVPADALNATDTGTRPEHGP
ncbi:MAG: hypothetical protein K8T26_15600 [Lentisphaerae bacterium]|nr:hypothetical protein [Lentisphaerota bacterium]